MSLKQKLVDLTTAITGNLNTFRSWVEGEVTSIYDTIQGVVDSIPTANSELTNDSNYATVTEVESRTPPIQVVTQAQFDALGDTTGDPTIYLIEEV